ncbi:MAG: 16S rRNA processing protein RimM [Deltaproteobacteria bacterium]|nr:16S rRNA processing protein RimM [Deltaproteobacteria bacterium]
MEFLEVGRIVKPHDFTGRMKVVSYCEGDLRKFAGVVFLRHGSEEPAPFNLRDVRGGKKNPIVSFEGIDSADAASALVGAEILIAPERFAKLPDDEFYWWELIGLEVLNEEGQPLGRIETVFPTGGADVYVCTGGEREILLPAVGEVIRNVDKKKRTMVVRLLEGL